jgi:glycosyltransferase involved in cell wall biosynthesis
LIISLLILSTPNRSALLSRLLDTLTPQLNKDVEVLVAIDRAANVGEKRNRLLRSASGQYVAFIDDDDNISARYVFAILEAIEREYPDCVGFKVRRFRDGRQEGEAIHSRRFKRNLTREDKSGWVFERTPNHLNPVRTDIAREVGFQSLPDMEDVDYAKRLRPLLTRETFVNEYLYDYLYVSPEKRENNQNAKRTIATA